MQEKPLYTHDITESVWLKFFGNYLPLVFSVGAVICIFCSNYYVEQNRFPLQPYVFWPIWFDLFLSGIFLVVFFRIGRPNPERKLELFYDRVQFTRAGETQSVPVAKASFRFCPFYPSSKRGNLNLLCEGKTVFTFRPYQLDLRFERMVEDLKMEFPTDEIPYCVLWITIFLIFFQRANGTMILLGGVVLFAYLLKAERKVFTRDRRYWLRGGAVAFLLALNLGAFFLTARLNNGPYLQTSLSQSFKSGDAKGGIEKLETYAHQNPSFFADEMLARIYTAYPDAAIQNAARGNGLAIKAETEMPLFFRLADHHFFYETLACSYFANKNAAQALLIGRRYHLPSLINQFAQNLPCESETLLSKAWVNAGRASRTLAGKLDDDIKSTNAQITASETEYQNRLNELHTQATEGPATNRWVKDYLENSSQSALDFLAFERVASVKDFCKLEWSCFRAELLKKKILFANDAQILSLTILNFAGHSKLSLLKCDATCNDQVNLQYFSAYADLIEQVQIQDFYVYREPGAQDRLTRTYRLREELDLLGNFLEMQKKFAEFTPNAATRASDEYQSLASRFQRLKTYPHDHGFLVDQLKKSDFDAWLGNVDSRKVEGWRLTFDQYH
jgi:hypothetical protein